MEQLINRLIDENTWLRSQLEAVLCNVFEDYPVPVPRAGGRRGMGNGHRAPSPVAVPPVIESTALPEWQSQASSSFTEIPFRGTPINASEVRDNTTEITARESGDILDLF